MGDMETEDTEPLGNRATKDVTVSALSLTKKSVYKTREKIQSKVITRGGLKNLKRKDGDKSVEDNTRETRKNPRHNKDKKDAEHEYGEITFTSCKVERKRKEVRRGNELNNSKKKNLNSDEAFSSKKAVVTKRALKRKSITDHLIEDIDKSDDTDENEDKQHDIVVVKRDKKNDGKKQKKTGKRSSTKGSTNKRSKTEGKKEDSDSMGEVNDNTEFEGESDGIEHDLMKVSHRIVSTKHGKSRKQKIYKCTYEGCLKEFTKEYFCQKHISKSHLILKFECEFCGLTFKQKNLLSSHFNSVHKKDAPTSWLELKESTDRIKCIYEGCDKDFGHPSNLKKHINGVHLGLRNFHCEFCAFRFKSSSALKNHIAVLHTKERDMILYECKVCKKKFPRKGSLSMHETIHTDIKPFTCTFEGCGKTFRLSTTLNKHKNIHTDEKPYNCHICGERFTRRAYRDTHMYKHTGVKNYSCEICQKSFSQKGNLKTHTLLHSKERPIYKCPECSQTFNFKSNMKKHLEKHMSEDWIYNKRVSSKLGEEVSDVESNKREASSQSCSNDFITVKTPLNKISPSKTGKKGELSPSKLLIAPAFSQKSGMPIKVVLNPVNNQKDKDQGKMLKQVNTSTVVTEVRGIRRIEAKKISPVKIANQSSEPTGTTNECHVVNDKSNINYIEEDENAVNVMLDIESLEKTDKTQGNKVEKIESFIRPPIYVTIEEITQDSNESVLNQRECNGSEISVEKLNSVVNNKPTFTIEFDNDGLPVARLQEGEQSVNSDICSYDLSSGEDPTKESEQVITDVIEVSSNTSGENQIDDTEQIVNNIANRSDNLQMESPIHIDVTEQILTGSNSPHDEAVVFEQIVNVIKQVNNTHEVVETTVEELIVSDSILQVSAENSDVLIDSAASYSFPPSQ